MRKLEHSVPDLLLTHIGDMTVSFALLEHQIQCLIGVFLVNQRMGQIITAELSFRNLINLLASLYLDQLGKKHADYPVFKGLIKRASLSECKRNIVTHSLWLPGEATNTFTRSKITAKEKHGLKFDWEDVSDIKLMGLVEEIKVLAYDFQLFMFKLRGVDIAPLTADHE